MKKNTLSYCILYLFIVLNGNAQVRYDSNYISSYYLQKVTQFKLMPKSTGSIVFLGDSITDIGEWSELFGNKTIKNRGISTDNTFGVLARLDETIASKPTKVFLMIGINDLAKKTPDVIILKNIKRITDQISQYSPNTKLIIQSILPTNNNFTEFAGYQNKDEHIIWLNNQLSLLCTRQQLIFVDLYSVFKDENGKLNKRYTYDGLHLNGEGYQLWKATLLKLKLI
jgi:lysophospholipase L1-like esterase